MAGASVTFAGGSPKDILGCQCQSEFNIGNVLER
jgi:hypothetical protein